MKLPVDYTKLKPHEKRLIREEYIKVQGGKCYYCGSDLTGQPEEKTLNKKVKPHLYPNGFFDHPVHLHHCHVTNLTIGAVHCHCNAVLWEYEGK